MQVIIEKVTRQWTGPDGSSNTLYADQVSIDRGDGPQPVWGPTIATPTTEQIALAVGAALAAVGYGPIDLEDRRPVKRKRGHHG